MRVRPRLREALARMSALREHALDSDLDEAEARVALDIVESAIAAHALPSVRRSPDR